MLRLLLSLSLVCALFAQRAVAEDGIQSSVFVGPFESKSTDLIAMSELVRGYVQAGLDRDARFDLLYAEDVPDISGTSAELYTDSCPPNQAVGCAFVVAEYAGLDFAIAGVVDVLDGQSFVRVSFIDVPSGREALSIDIPLEQNSNETLSSGVAALLAAVVKGELGREEDIRDFDVEDPDSDRDREIRVAELEALSSQLGALAVDPEGRVLSRSKYTMEDFAEDYVQEGIKPWERLGLTPKSYLRYRNSGQDLLVWRTRASGRRAQVLFRPAVGFVRGPTDGWYYGHYLLDEMNPALESPLATYAFEALIGGMGTAGGFDLGFGLLPFAEVAAGWRVVSGEYAFQINDEINGQTFISKAAEVSSNRSTEVFLAFRVAPTPTAGLRPVFELGIARWQGSHVEDHILLGALPLPVFDRPTLFGPRIVIGGEIRVGERFELFGQLPLRAFVFGASDEQEEESAWMIASSESPPVVSPFAVGFEAGFQFRFGGVRVADALEAPRLDAEEDAF